MSLHCHFCGKTGTALTNLEKGQYWPPSGDAALVPMVGSVMAFNDKADGTTIPRPARWRCWDSVACVERQIDKEKTPVKENEGARDAMTIRRLEEEVRQLRHDLEALARHVAERDARVERVFCVLDRGARGEVIPEAVWEAHLEGTDCGKRPCQTCAPDPSDGA